MTARIGDERGEHGFTLVEILIVIVIIGILASTAIPLFGKAREEATSSTMVSDLRTNSPLIEQYTYLHHAFPKELPEGAVSSPNNILDIVVTDDIVHSPDMPPRAEMVITPHGHAQNGKAEALGSLTLTNGVNAGFFFGPGKPLYLYAIPSSKKGNTGKTPPTVGISVECGGATYTGTHKVGSYGSWASNKGDALTEMRTDQGGQLKSKLDCFPSGTPSNDNNNIDLITVAPAAGEPITVETSLLLYTSGQDSSSVPPVTVTPGKGICVRIRNSVYPELVHSYDFDTRKIMKNYDCGLNIDHDLS